MHEKQPPVQRDEAGPRQDPEHRPKERVKDGGDSVDKTTRHHRCLEVQGKQWVWPLQLETGSISSSKHPERPQFAVRQDPDVVFTDTPTKLLGHRLGDLLVAATAVG